MDSIIPRKRYSSWLLCVSFIVVVALTVTFAVVLSQSSTAQNVENRVFKELSSTAELQCSTLQHHIEEQYQPLMVIAAMLEDGETFASEEMKPMLDAMVDTHVLCMLGFADLDGNSIWYEGEPRGNISDRAYFQKVVSGEADSYCEFLATTKTLDEPRVLFSVPAYRDGEIIGVLYCSKEVKVLEDSLFEHDKLFDDSFIIFICAADGKMIVANETARKECLVEGAEEENFNVFEQMPDVENMYLTGAETGRVSLHEADAYASFVPLGINDWMLGCVIDAETATKAYASNLANIQHLATSLIVVLILALGYIMLLACILLRKERSEMRVIKRYYENYKMLLNEMDCTVIEHDPSDSTIISIKGGNDPYGIASWKGSIDAYENYKKQHPEFDFIELKTEVRLALKENKTHSFESIIVLSSGKIHWVRVILVPVMDENSAQKLFGVILDITDTHEKFDSITETFKKIPGGIHRCYLSNPIHLEYFNEGLCKMLGYTYEEVANIVMPEQKYSLLIYPEDRPTFRDFAKSLAATGGIQTCEYRMMCKDGSLLLVSDTMDAKMSSSGIMYGYSVVTDLHKYKQIQEQLEQKLEATGQQLELARLKNSSSQMQPHFLYNALASIREIVLDDPEYASDLIYDFTTHLRACIRSMAGDNLVTFSQELENIKSYVNIEKMRFGEKLSIEYDCPETGFDIIPLSIQPLVENAIRHGIYERGTDGGTVKVNSCREGNHFVVQVEDNGIGFDFETTMKEVKNGERDSTGLFNLILRLETLLNAHVEVDSQIGIGTKITVTIPIGGNQ